MGGGKSTSAAAIQLGRKNSTWWNNKFKGWAHSGGNGAAMRVQPHVWVARAPAEPESYLLDVVRNSVCTHSHPTGLAGAVFHALCVAHATSVGDLPSPGDLHAAIKTAGCLPEIIARDRELRYWRIAFEREAGNFDESWAKAMSEVQTSINLIATCGVSASGKESYEDITEKLKLRDPAHRGNGILTAVAAIGLAWCEACPAEAMRIAANAIGTDTDTIATMAGAILGVTSDIDPPVDVLDATMIRSEAKRMAKIAVGENPPSHNYPDLLHWTAPKTRSDALVRSKDGGLIVPGLGRARKLEENSVLASGDFHWQWIRLELGQTLLIKTRSRPPDAKGFRVPMERPAPVTGNEQPTLPTAARQGRPEGEFIRSSRTRSLGEHDAPRARTGDHDIRKVVSYVEEHIDDDQAVGRALRRVVRKGTTGEIAGFSAALIDLLRSHSEPKEPG